MWSVNQVKLNWLKLKDFRNHQRKDIVFEDNITWITGENGWGKTNILESIYLLATGKSNRASKTEEMIRWGSGVASVEGGFEIFTSLVEKSDQECLQVILTKGEIEGKKMPIKLLKVNGIGRQLRKFVGNLPAVWFGPEDLDIVTGSASLRRKFMDQVGELIDSEYARALNDYQKALKRRNQLLDLLREGKVDRSVFSYYDSILVKAGKYIQFKRRELVDYLNKWFEESSDFCNMHLEYDWSEISYERLEKYQVQETAIGQTMVGPQRDDLIVKMELKTGNWHRIDVFGSRGQQRMGVLGLKIAELEFVSRLKEKRPILLLDDVLSELDERHQNIVAQQMRQQQTIVSGVRAL